MSMSVSGQPIYGPLEVPSYLLAPRPKSICDSVIYRITRPVAVIALYRLFSPSVFTVFGYKQFYEHCRELLTDLGGQTISIRTEDGVELDGMYFAPQTVKANEEGAYDKWKVKFAAHDQTAKLLEADLDGDSMTSLLGLPEIASNPNEAIKGVVVCMGAGSCYEFDPQSVMIYANQGKHVLFFNYRGILTNKGTPDCRTTFEDCKSACLWMKSHLDCENEELLVHGKSLGGSNALYAATQVPGMDVIVDRSFYSLGDVVKDKMTSCIKRPILSLIEKFYPYHNDEMISRVAGRVFIMKAKDDTLIPENHADRLFEKLVASKLGDFATQEQIEAFKERYFVVVPGSHSGVAGGDDAYSWSRFPESYVKLNEFLLKEEYNPIPQVELLAE